MFKVLEISSANGLISDYALCRARGEGGKPDPKLKALLADHAQRLKEKQEMAKLESSANSKSQLTEAKPPATGRSVKNMDSVIIESTAIEVVKEMSLKCNLVYAFQ